MKVNSESKILKIVYIYIRAYVSIYIYACKSFALQTFLRFLHQLTPFFTFKCVSLWLYYGHHKKKKKMEEAHSFPCTTSKSECLLLREYCSTEIILLLLLLCYWYFPFFAKNSYTPYPTSPKKRKKCKVIRRRFFMERTMKVLFAFQLL